MGAQSRLGRTFFHRATLGVARELIGKRLVCIQEDGERLSGRITETEAYVGPEDLGCHAKAGRTPRNRVMWEAPGHAYVYFTYGMHWLLNFVTEPAGFPAAVLIRGLRAEEGLARMEGRRGPVPTKNLTSGPARLCQALGVDAGFNGHDLCAPGARLFLEDAPGVPDELVFTGSRVGLNTVPEPWKSIPWRFWINHLPKGHLARYR